MQNSTANSQCFVFNSLIFGAITCFTGFLGVITGAGATKWCRLKTQRADPLVCAVGMLGSAIFICLIFVAAKSSIVGAYVSMVHSENCEWAGTILQVQPDTKPSRKEAVFILAQSGTVTLVLCFPLFLMLSFLAAIL